MEYQGQQISMQVLKSLPEGCYFLDNMKSSSQGGEVIPKSRLVKAVQSSEIPQDNLRINKIEFIHNSNE